MAPSANPFAAPRPARTPDEARQSVWGMVSRFEVDGSVVEVETSHWSGREVYRVDGREVLRARNLGWHARAVLEVAGRQVEITSRWYPLLPVVVTVDGARRVDDLFPQLRPLKAAALAILLPIVALLAWSIALDLAHLWGVGT